MCRYKTENMILSFLLPGGLSMIQQQKFYNLLVEELNTLYADGITTGAHMPTFQSLPKQ